MRLKSVRLKVAVLMAAALPALAQTLSISGSVSDAQGVIPDVPVTLHASTGADRAVSTDSSGKYSFTGLAAGRYELTFAREGFETVSRSVTLTDDPATGELSVTLKPASVSTTVDVTDVAGKATGSRMDVPDKDLPVQVSVISSEVLQSKGVNDMVSALQNASGVSATRWYGVYEYYTIRGFNSQDVALVDGMRLEGNRANTQLNNVETVEVLKGPNSILYGAQALGGTINIVRKKPQAARTYDLYYKGGRFYDNQAGGGATGTVPGLKSLLYRTDFSFENSDGWRGAGARRINLSPSLTWLIGEKTRVTVFEAFNRDRFNGDSGLPVGVLSIPGFDLSHRFDPPSDFALVRDLQNQVTLNSTLSPHFELRNSFMYRLQNDQYDVAEQLNYNSALNSVDRTRLYFMHHRHPKQDQADVLGHVSFLGMYHTFVAGYEYEDYFDYTNRCALCSVAITPVSLATFAETYVQPSGFPLSEVDYFSNLINAFFWQDQVSLTKRLKVNVGGRFDDYQRRAHNDPYNNNVFVSRGPEIKVNQNAYTYRAGLVYGITESQQLYFSSSSSFNPVTSIPANGATLAPETGRSYEFGHRWQGLGGRLSVSTALYRIVRQNVAISLPGGNYEQAGQESAKGIDFDINGNVGKGIRLIVNYGYTLPRYDDYWTSSHTVNLSGFTPKFTQKHAANVWLTKVWKSGVTASVGMRYLGPMFTNDNDTIREGGWTTFSGAFGFRRSFYEWSLNAENMLDRQRYFLAGIYTNQLYPGTPINVFTSLRFRFH